MPRLPKTKPVVMTRTLKLRQEVLTCIRCGVLFKYQGYSGNLPTRCPECKVIVAREARLATYYKRQAEIKEEKEAESKGKKSKAKSKE